MTTTPPVYRRSQLTVTPSHNQLTDDMVIIDHDASDLDAIIYDVMIPLEIAEPEPDHQGFTNYETFSVAITLDTDRGSHDFWHERAREALAQFEGYADDDGLVAAAALVVADALKDSVEEGAPELDGFYASLLGAGMGEVDWFDIARHWIDDVLEEDRG